MRNESPASHHLYVHVPFCRLVCAYCDFVTVGGRADDIPRYTEALRAELTERPAPGELRTIYFGGGTPSLLSGDQVGRLITAATDRWEHVSLEEITVEANPSLREVPDWDGFAGAGVTRISLGVQSLRDADLHALARGHTAAEARQAFAAARAAGIGDISVDLIYGIPGQSLEDWREGLERAIELGPDHLSCYALQLVLSPDEWAAPPRPGAQRWRSQMADRQDDGLASDQYRLAEEVLGSVGFAHYELSSWARPGHQSRHNSAYWARHAYTGVGAGAHSYDGVAGRSWNVRELDRYLGAAEARLRPIDGCEELDPETLAFEALALSLRRVEGISRAAFREEFGADPVDRYAGAVLATTADALLEVDGDVMRLTQDGRLMASEVLVAFLPEPAGRR
ncbi:MAG: radical SAM family heme chaperone HemW [Chloroflexota bacterium]|nr:radical SAM family heme chaperone HemW [Chloroflexota bacterium]